VFKPSNKALLILSIILLAVFAYTLYLMGQVPICECGYIKLWHGVTYSSENSQHLSDWYSFSHIIHGFAFFFIAWLISRKWRYFSIKIGFLLALIAEIGWEIFENTDFIINRYREVTISLDYFGDSIINSVFDVLFMAFGFWLAKKLPIWTIIVLIIAMELFVGYFIRDNLTLNIIMLIYPFKAILNWQMST
jgi:hypothetical protein